MQELIGHNQPPSQIKFSEETSTVLSLFLQDHPVIQTEEEARAGKLLVDRARLCLADLEAERTAAVAPLNEKVKAINDEYRSPRGILDKILTQLKDRLDAWLKIEEEKRFQAAEEARRKAEEAERLAREAEAREQEAAQDAKVGVETDIGTATREADAAYAAFRKAERELARAEKDTNARIPGGFGRALSLKFKETLVVTDPTKAVSVTGWSQRLLEALKTEAREYRKLHGHLPDGVTATGERKI